MLYLSRGQVNFRGLEVSRPRTWPSRPVTSKCVFEDVLEAKDVFKDSTSANEHRSAVAAIVIHSLVRMNQALGACLHQRKLFSLWVFRETWPSPKIRLLGPKREITAICFSYVRQIASMMIVDDDRVPLFGWCSKSYLFPAGFSAQLFFV